MSELIKKNISDLKNKIQFLCDKYKRDFSEIELIAVSKYQKIEDIKNAHEYGLNHFGENYIQEWKEKSEFILTELNNIKWHIIGNLQKNKAKFLNNQIHCLQSLDNLSLAKEIERKSPLDTKLNVLIQIQMDKNDITKSGIPSEKANELIEFIANSKKLNFQGFMGIGPEKMAEIEKKDLYFKFTDETNMLWEKYYHQSNQKPIISLGMSSDYELAIECGSTMLRIGSAIFGERKVKKQNGVSKTIF